MLSQSHPALGWSYAGNRRAAATSVTFLDALGVWTLDTAENLPTFKKAVMVQPYALSLSKFTLKHDFNCYVQTNTSLLSLSSCFVSPVQTKITIPFFMCMSNHKTKQRQFYPSIPFNFCLQAFLVSPESSSQTVITMFIDLEPGHYPSFIFLFLPSNLTSCSSCLTLLGHDFSFPSN